MADIDTPPAKVTMAEQEPQQPREGRWGECPECGAESQPDFIPSGIEGIGIAAMRAAHFADCRVLRRRR